SLVFSEFCASLNRTGEDLYFSTGTVAMRRADLSVEKEKSLEGNSLTVNNSVSNMEQAPTESNGHGMSPIIGLKLVHDILDVEVYGGLGNRELIGNLLVAISVADQFENL